MGVGDTRAMAIINTYIEDPSREVRWAAVEALGNLSPAGTNVASPQRTARGPPWPEWPSQPAPGYTGRLEPPPLLSYTQPRSLGDVFEGVPRSKGVPAQLHKPVSDAQAIIPEKKENAIVVKQTPNVLDGGQTSSSKIPDGEKIQLTVRKMG